MKRRATYDIDLCGDAILTFGAPPRSGRAEPSSGSADPPAAGSRDDLLDSSITGLPRDEQFAATRPAAMSNLKAKSRSRPFRKASDNVDRRGATTTTTTRSDVRSSSCICVSGGRWSTASVYGASSTAPAVASVQDAEVLGTAARTVSCPTGKQDIARSAGAPSSCMPASSFRGN